MNSPKIGAISGISAPIVAIICILWAITTYPAFSWTNNALSDLGIVPGITQWLFNGGLCIAGGLVLIFTIFGLHHYVNKTWIGRAGSWIFGVASIMLVLIGIFNESFVSVHFIVAVAFFILVSTALFILTSHFYQTRQYTIASFTATIAIIATLPWIVQLTLPYVSNVAIPETISALAISAWTIGLSTKIHKPTQNTTNPVTKETNC